MSAHALNLDHSKMMMLGKEFSFLLLDQWLKSLGECNTILSDYTKYIEVHLDVYCPFPSKAFFLCVCSTSDLKTLWEKEKLPITSNFSFFHTVFYPLGGPATIFIKFKIIVCIYSFSLEELKICHLRNG